MPPHEPLAAEDLRWCCTVEQFEFRDTSELPDYAQLLGQSRALEAIEFGIGIRHDRFNIYALGPSGLGKRTAILDMLQRQASGEPVPNDLCYVNRFDQPHSPLALQLPAGRGRKLRDDMATFAGDLARSIPAALESDEHRNRLRQLERESQERQNDAFEQLGRQALEQNLQLVRTPSGFALAPLRDGEVITPAEFEKLPEEEKQRVTASVESMQEDLRQAVAQVPVWRKETEDRIRDLNREAVRLAFGHLMAELRGKYTDLDQVLAYLDSVERDILERVDEFHSQDDTPALPFPLPRPSEPSFDEYLVNLLVDHAEASGAPVIYEDHPTYQNLFGRVEHETQMGTLVTNFGLIKCGALHQANGGYLVIDAWRMLAQPFAWDSLKRAIYSQQIKIESLGEMYALISTVSLQPEPVELDIKVVLLGDRLLYYLMLEYDPDFAELFKVAADFDEQMERTAENCRRYAEFLGTMARRERLHPLDPSGVARAVEYSARVAEDSSRLSLHMRTMSDLLREAEYWARRDAAEVIAGEHIERAIQKRIHRADRIRQRIYEEIQRDTIRIETEGQRVGQVNGLSVIHLGDFSFGQPSRITATARLGKGELVDIEREVKLGGALHSKGVLILGSFLAARYARDEILSLSASLVFEQSYAMVEGDSASVAELCALLSAIAEVPVRQSLAVTGSVDQFGQVQAIGGVNQKIEGFYDVCRARGQSAGQGVLIPQSNVKHLMLREDVVADARLGRFHIYAIRTIDEALALLTGRDAGEPGAAGQYPEHSVNGLVAKRLKQLSDIAKKLPAAAAAGVNIALTRNPDEPNS